MRSSARGGEAGFSLVEATLVLTVVAVLSAVFAPSIREYVDDARRARAQQDVQRLTAALEQMLADTGETFFLRDGNGALPEAPPSRTASNRVHLLVSSGNTPAVAASIDRAAGSTDWDDALDGVTVWSFHAHLVANAPGYRGPADMTDSGRFDPVSGGGVNSAFAWRGAYIAPVLGPDPWGHRYAANVEFLGRLEAASPSGNNVFVLSAGANGRVDTAFAATTPTFASDIADDIVAPLAGGRR